MWSRDEKTEYHARRPGSTFIALEPRISFLVLIMNSYDKKDVIGLGLMVQKFLIRFLISGFFLLC